MGTVGSFFTGVAVGIAGLVAVSWFVATQCEENSEKEEESCGQ